MDSFVVGRDRPWIILSHSFAILNIPSKHKHRDVVRQLVVLKLAAEPRQPDPQVQCQCPKSARNVCSRLQT